MAATRKFCVLSVSIRTANRHGGALLVDVVRAKSAQFLCARFFLVFFSTLQPNNGMSGCTVAMTFCECVT
jgi:hypothetical protein